MLKAHLIAAPLLVLAALPAQAQQANMTFFITSTPIGNGGNLGGSPMDCPRSGGNKSSCSIRRAREAPSPRAQPRRPHLTVTPCTCRHHRRL